VKFKDMMNSISFSLEGNLWHHGIRSLVVAEAGVAVVVTEVWAFSFCMTERA
jgi:hypothetical protein